MALSIGVAVGSRIDVGGHEVRVKEIPSPNIIVISVDNKEFVITEERSVPILPKVKVQIGVGSKGAGNRLAFDAPREIRISRVEDRKKQTHAGKRTS